MCEIRGATKKIGSVLTTMFSEVLMVVRGDRPKEPYAAYGDEAMGARKRRSSPFAQVLNGGDILMNDLHTLIAERRERLMRSLTNARVTLPDTTIERAAQLWTAIVYALPDFDATRDEDTALEMIEAFCDRSPEDAGLPEDPSQLHARAAILHAIFPSRTFDAWRGLIANTSIS